MLKVNKMVQKNIIISMIITIISLILLKNFLNLSQVTNIIAIIVVIAFSMASLGVTEYFFGDKNKRFTMEEIAINVALIIGIVLLIAYILPQQLLGRNELIMAILGI